MNVWILTVYYSEFIVASCTCMQVKLVTDRHTGELVVIVAVLWLPYSLVTVCTDIVTVRIGIAYSNCTVATVHIGNSVH